MQSTKLLTPLLRRHTSIALHYRYYSAPASSTLLKVSQVPAPHCGTIRIVSLNRPAARNAISRQLLTDLSREVESIHSDGELGSTRALIVASEVDASFCAGADLKERATMSQEETQAFLAQLRHTFSRLASLPVPTISAISSLAFGGGLELALCTSLRVFATCASVALPETRLAILPGAGGTYRLPGIVGLNRARDLILTGRRVGGPEAYFLGLCDRLVEVTEEEVKIEGKAREKVLDVAMQLAREICEGGPVAIGAAKRAVEGYLEGEKSENAAYDIVVKTRDRDEALLAFREKRKPVFKGR